MFETPGESQAHILLIEDTAARSSLQELLVEERFRVTAVGNPREAMAYLRADPPDCVLCAHQLPGIDGLALCREVKAESGLGLMPVVLVAEIETPQNTFDMLDAGADDVLRRPVQAREVSARVRSLVRRRHMTRALETSQNVVYALATALEHKDKYTEGHGERVAVFARHLAEHIGLPPHEVQAVYTGGLLHDVGKIGCPDAVLNKPGPLTPDEFQIIKRHPVDGWEICRHLKSLGHDTLCCIRNHHERLDGTGYPDALDDSKIPTVVRITSICDVFDALATARAYKPAFPTDTCFRILREEAERGWWDKELVEAFIDMMRQHELDQPTNRAKLEPLLKHPLQP